MRIGIDGDTLGRKRTGDESYLASLLRGLLRTDADNDYLVFVRDESVGDKFDRSTRWTFRRVRPTSIWVRWPIGLPFALRCHPVDLLHAQYFISPACPCPVVLTVHDISFAVRPHYFTWRDRLLLSSLVPSALRRASRIITDTEYTKNDIIRVYGVDPARIAVIPLAADPRFRVLDREESRAFVDARHRIGAPFVLYVGTLQPRKNVETLIRAYAMFRRKTGLPHRLLLAGRPKYRFQAVFEAIRKSGFEDDILFAGYVPDADLPSYYGAASAFVFPSRYEGFGLPVLEAMACGTPVVCSSASCLPEVAGDAALMADAEDAEGFCGGLERILGEAGCAAAMRERGLRRASQFSWNRTARETLEVYRRAAETRR